MFALLRARSPAHSCGHDRDGSPQSQRDTASHPFGPDELAALSEGRLPGSDEPLYEPTTRSSIRVRPPGTDTRDLERRLAGELDPTGVEAAYLVETDSGNGDRRLMLGLVGEPGTSATVDVPDGTDVVWLEEPLLAQVRAVADPFHRRGRGR